MNTTEARLRHDVSVCVYDDDIVYNSTHTRYQV